MLYFILKKSFYMILKARIQKHAVKVEENETALETELAFILLKISFIIINYYISSLMQRHLNVKLNSILEILKI